MPFDQKGYEEALERVLQKQKTDSVPLSEMLDRFEEWTLLANNIFGQHPNLFAKQEARQSIESFVTALIEENGHLLRALTASNADYERLHEQHRALRSSSLTPEEAAAVVGIAPEPEDATYADQHEAYARGIAKLRSLEAPR